MDSFFGRLALTLSSCLALGLAALAQQRGTPVFRAGVDLVPVDVSVLDSHGKPVTDLRQQDFTILEDKVPQTIKAFSATALTPQPPAPGAPAALVRSDPAAATAETRLTPQTRRTFLIVIGFGRLQEPTKAYDATIEFIRRKLLPQDLVSVLAWNRATDFTTDHEQVAQFVERYKKRNDAVTQQMLDANPHLGFWPIQKLIDEVFDPPQGSHTLGTRSAVPMLLGTDAFKWEDRGAAAIPWDYYMAIGGPHYDPPQKFYFDGDLPKVYAGIEYLRHLEGQKHLILVTKAANVYRVGIVSQIEAGLAGPSEQNDEWLAARAGDARIVMDVIYTAGVPGFTGFSKQLSKASQVSNPEFVWGAASAEHVAEGTGGLFLGTFPAEATFSRIDEATRFGYLLGYSPANVALKDQLRKIVVKVNRPGLTVLFRHGYHPEENLPASELKAMTAAFHRLAAAGYDREGHDIAVSGVALELPNARGGRDLRVDLRIDISRLTFTMENGRHLSSIDLAVYGGDQKQAVIGQKHDTLQIDMDDAEFTAAQKEGIRYTVRVAVAGDAKFAKVVVYDFGADLTGTAMMTVR